MLFNFKKNKPLISIKKKVEFIGEEKGIDTCGQVFEKGKKYKVDEEIYQYLKKNFKTKFKL